MTEGWGCRLQGLHAAAVARVPDRPSWNDVHARARRTTIGALVVDTAAVSVDELHDASIDDLPEDLRAALERLSPDIDISTLANYPEAALDGMANAVKGALFELRVAEALTSGELELPDGASSFRLVEDFATPGHDLELLDEDGEVVELVQLKATDTADLIREHLSTHPHIDDVWTTSEGAEAASAAGIGSADDTGIEDAALSAFVSSSLQDQSTTSFGEVLDEVVPQLALAVIAGRASLELWRGASMTEMLSRARSHAEGAILMSALAGVAASVSGTDAVRIPAVVTVAIVRTATTEVEVSRDELRALRQTVRDLARRSVHADGAAPVWSRRTGTGCHDRDR